MSDYSPPYGLREQALDDRRTQVMRRLEEVKLKDLTMGDLMSILGMFEPHTCKFYKSRLCTSDLDAIEKILWESR